MPIFSFVLYVEYVFCIFTYYLFNLIPRFTCLHVSSLEIVKRSMAFSLFFSSTFVRKDISMLEVQLATLWTESVTVKVALLEEYLLISG